MVSGKDGCDFWKSCNSFCFASVCCVSASQLSICIASTAPNRSFDIKEQIMVMTCRSGNHWRKLDDFLANICIRCVSRISQFFLVRARIFSLLNHTSKHCHLHPKTSILIFSYRNILLSRILLGLAEDWEFVLAPYPVSAQRIFHWSILPHFQQETDLCELQHKH